MSTVQVTTVVQRVLVTVGGTIAGVPVGSEYISYQAARLAPKVTDTYLRTADGAPMNLAPLVLPFDATLEALTLRTSASHSWTLEVQKNGVLVAVASLSSGGSAKAVDSTLSIDFVAGDEIALYVAGTDVPHPSASLSLVRKGS